MTLNDFKSIVDDSSATISNSSLEQVYSELNIDATNGHNGKEVSDKLYENIREIFQTNDKDVKNTISQAKFLKLESILVHRCVLYDEDPIEYLKIIKVIRDACRKDIHTFPPFSEKMRWKEAVENCKNFNKFSPSVHSLSLKNLREDYPKYFDAATSLKVLVEKGCVIEVTDLGVEIKGGLEPIVDELDEMVKKIGGITLAKKIFHSLRDSKKYSERFHRYFLIRESSGLASDKKPQIPFGLLLNLCVKHPYEGNINNNKIVDIVNLATIISNGVYEAQHYSMWEFHFQTGDTIIEFFTEIALWDSLFSIPQCKPSSAIEICEELFSFIPEKDFQAVLGFTLQEFITVIKELDSLPEDVHTPKFIFPNKLKASYKIIGKDKVCRILDSISHNQRANRDYLLPSDYSLIDFGQNPLINLKGTKFLLFNRSWSAPNYFEALATPLRQESALIKKLDDKLGLQIEEFLQRKFSSKGISFSSGDYKFNGVDGECDFLIETNKAIILIEVKKKVLTRKSKSGSDIEIFIDLSDSILYSQIQAGRTEIILRETGSIILEKNGNKNTISLNGRNVERVTLTQLDFGGFQDKSIIIQFFNALLTHSYHTHSSEKRIIDKFAALNRKQEIWREQYDKLCKLDKAFEHFPFFNCWFMNLPQILEIINLATDNDSFYDTLTKTKSVTFNTLDWYHEFDIMTRSQYENNQKIS